MAVSMVAVLFACALLMATPAQAEIVLRDEWESAGTVTVDADRSTLVLRKNYGGVELRSGDQVVRLSPVGAQGVESASTLTWGIAQESPDRAVIRALHAAGDAELGLSFVLTDAGMVTLTAKEGVQGVRIAGELAAGILPGIRLEDVVYRPEDFAELDRAHVPPENWFAALIAGGNGMVALAWPDGRQSVSLLCGEDAEAFRGVEVALDGKRLHIQMLSAPGIWHGEPLELGYLERNVELAWRRPFPATYKTQLSMRAETTAARTFVFRNKPFEQYWPEIGECSWPVWFEEDRAFMRLSKKIPPRGEAIIYPFDEGDLTLMGFIRRTPLGEAIEARNAQLPLPHGPRDVANVGFVACGGTNVMRRTLFELGLQQREREFLSEYADFLADYVAIVQQRNITFLQFVDATRNKVEDWMSKHEADSDVAAYLEQMLARADRTESGLRRKLELYGDNTPEAHIDHADRACARLKELLNTTDPELEPESDELIFICNRLAWGHAEVVGMRFSMLARAWAEEAASLCAGRPAAAPYAVAVRASIREALNGAPPW
jgi:hypothetical protein